MKIALARTLSILGHPLLALPAAALLVAAWSGMGARHWTLAAIALALIALIIQGWSWWQVRRGKWQHVDASQHHERQGLNRFLLVLLAGAAGYFALVSPQPALSLGLACAAAIIATSMLLASWLKLSLHAAFAMFAALLLWALGPAVLAVGCLFAAAVAWSRWVLGRHRRRELMAGAMVGTTAGMAFWALLPRLA